jgi:hypothetical protein
MASPPTASSSHKVSLSKDLEAEERTRLLSSDHTSEYQEPEIKTGACSRKKIAITAIALLGFLLTGTLGLWVNADPQDDFEAKSATTELLSNGTHEFKRTVLIVSIDGLR